MKELCKNCPIEILDYMVYVRNMKFEEDPNFDYIFLLIQNMARKYNFSITDNLFDWCIQETLGPEQ